MKRMYGVYMVFEMSYTILIAESALHVKILGLKTG